MPWSKAVKEEALVACMRCCCICHRPCGIKIELHHIIPESKGGNSTLENCIPLCLDCHSDVEHYNPNHPKGTRFSESELKAHRKRWFALVERGPLAPRDEELLAMDRRVAQEIHVQMTRVGTYDFLRFQSMKSSFPYSPYEALWKLKDALVNPDMEFHDAALESERARFLELISQFTSMAVQYVYRENFDRDSGSTGFAVMVPHEVFEERMRAIDELDKLGTAVAAEYEVFFRLIRKTLLLDLRFPESEEVLTK